VAISRCTDLDESVVLNDSEVSEISFEEASGESSFAEVPEPALESAVKNDYDVKAETEPVNDDWGMPTPVKSTKKSKKGKRAL
jgi:hypothetical protein